MTFKAREILFATRAIAPPWDEGSKNMVFQIATRLESFSSTLLTYKGQKNFVDCPSVKLKKIYSDNHSGILSLSQKWSFLRAILSGEADIYHFFFTPEAGSAKILRGIKFFKRGIFLQTIPTSLKNIDRVRSLVFSDAAVTQSDHTRKLLLARGVKNVTRIYPGVDTQKFSPGRDTARPKERLNICPQDRVVLFAGHYRVGCNEELIEAITSLSKSEKNLKFILACRNQFHAFDSHEKVRFQDAFKASGVAEQVIFLDQVEDMAELIALSDINIFPARHLYYKAEIPMVLLEALAMEKPVIITDISPLNEIMKDDVGETVPPGNTPALGRAIKNLLDDEALRKRKGEKGRKMVLREFSIETAVKAYADLYRRLLNARDRSRDSSFLMGK